MLFPCHQDMDNAPAKLQTSLVLLSKPTHGWNFERNANLDSDECIITRPLPHHTFLTPITYLRHKEGLTKDNGH